MNSVVPTASGLNTGSGLLVASNGPSTGDEGGVHAMSTAMSLVPGGSAVNSISSAFSKILNSIGGHPGPGKITQPVCASGNGVNGVKTEWSTAEWGMTGHCKVTGADAWNVALAMMKAAGDPRICKTLIPTRSGICPVVCDKNATNLKAGACSMKNAGGVLSGKNKSTPCASQPGNCSVTKPDNGSYRATAKNPAPSLTDIGHIEAVLRQGGTVADLSTDQKIAAGAAGVTPGSGFSMSSIFNGNSPWLMGFAAIAGVGSFILAWKQR